MVKIPLVPVDLKCPDTSRPKFIKTLRPKCVYSFCKQYI